MAPHTGGTVYSWELCGEADRVTQDCQCSTCAHCREELTPEELATLPFDATSAEEASTMDKSNGHVGFYGPYEYFTDAEGCLYRAITSYPISTNGYRQGARFEAMPQQARYLIERLPSIFGEE